MTRSLSRLGMCVSLVALLAACGDGTSTTGNEGGGTTTSSSTQGSTSSTTTTTSTNDGGGGTGGMMTGGGGTGGVMTGGGGTGGMMTGGGGTGGMMTGGGGTGGTTTSSSTTSTTTSSSMMVDEVCGNMVDDDGDMLTDCADTECAALPACGKLLINEVDYDGPGADNAEFIEIFNAGTAATDLTNLSVMLVDGANSMVYTEVPIGGVLAAGQYLVISPPTLGIEPGALFIPLPLAANNLQDGGGGFGDAVALYDNTGKVVLDSLSYEGAVTGAMIKGGLFNLVAGTATLAKDDDFPGKSLIRRPNAKDSGNDSADWTGTLTITPGKANIATEVCTDMLDNDGDMLIDCADPNCTNKPECGEICSNGTDDDGDLFVDCADPDCVGNAACLEVCNNNLDDDLDMLVDCFDPDCTGNVACTENCTNGTDDDGDLLVDCADPNCTNKPGCVEICNNGTDDDNDLLVDCADPNCTNNPGCVEICNNGTDDDGDLLVDCADGTCAAMSCGTFGKVCSLGACLCPGGVIETVCSGGNDEDCDGMVDCMDPDCALTVACASIGVAGVNYPVIAHGGTLVITGTGFTGATTVTIGGVGVPFTVDSNTQITTGAVLDTTPLAAQNLVVTTPVGATMPFQVTVIHLLINELDSDQVMTDMAEFVEIATGVPNVSLAGYTLVMWNGSNDLSYLALNLAGTTDANGLLLAGNTTLVPPPSPMCTWAASSVQNGQDAISIHQAAVASFPTNTMVSAANLIDALVYDTADADDPGLLDALIGPVGTLGRVQVDEGAAPTSETQSIQRCGDGRRRGDKFAVGAPTPGAANTVTACP